MNGVRGDRCRQVGETTPENRSARFLADTPFIFFFAMDTGAESVTVGALNIQKMPLVISLRLLYVRTSLSDTLRKRNSHDTRDDRDA